MRLHRPRRERRRVKDEPGGKAWLAVKIAIGQGEDATQWVRTVCFGETAERLASTLEKGAKVYIEGNLKLDRWKNDASEERSGLSVAAWKIEKVGASAIGRNRPPQGEGAAGGRESGSTIEQR